MSTSASAVDWSTIIAALILSVGPTAAGIAAYRQSSKTHKEVNSRMTELLNLAKASSHAMGVEDERARAQKRDRSAE